MESGTKERDAFFHQAFIPLCKLSAEPTLLSYGHRPSIVISDRCTVAARLTACISSRQIRESQNVARLSLAQSSSEKPYGRCGRCASIDVYVYWAFDGRG